jgi:hypothetical protein
MPDYKLKPGSVQEQFGYLRKKVQVFGGGFGNGKTAAAVVQKVLRVAKDYPGANILVARSTYPKLNDTIRKEFLKWCPKTWIKSFAMSKNSDNTCHMKNGTTINFRYIAQQGKGSAEGEQTTSNLLSATYDLVVVDQMEDPEIVHKDFLDLLGRLRGSARYVGDDPTMPSTGPRWFIMCLNPTRNWCYKKIVKPLQDYQKALENGKVLIGDDLLCRRYPSTHELAGQPILDENGLPELQIDLVEGPTYGNSHNLSADFIEMLESSYRGSMRDRFLLGQWAAYEGLVHPDFDETLHMVTEREIANAIRSVYQRTGLLRQVEGYDYGSIVPSCYMLAFADRHQNIYIVDGFYKSATELNIEEQQERIYNIREMWGASHSNTIICDPAILKKTVAQRKAKAKSIAELFGEGMYGVKMKGGNNDVPSGLAKVNQYLAPYPDHTNAINGMMDAPHLYINDKLTWISDEFNGYYFKKDSSGDATDDPIDKNDHAMNTLKYMLSKEKTLASPRERIANTSYLTQWQEAS